MPGGRYWQTFNKTINFRRNHNSVGASHNSVGAHVLATVESSSIFQPFKSIAWIEDRLRWNFPRCKHQHYQRLHPAIPGLSLSNIPWNMWLDLPTEMLEVTHVACLPPYRPPLIPWRLRTLYIFIYPRAQEERHSWRLLSAASRFRANVWRTLLSASTTYRKSSHHSAVP